MPYSPRIVSFNKGWSWIAKHDRCFHSADASQYQTLIGSCHLFRQQTHVPGLDIGYVPAGPNAFFRSSGQFGPQQFILCWPAGPGAFRSVANACRGLPVFSVDVSRVAVRWFDLQVFSSTELFYLCVLV